MSRAGAVLDLCRARGWTIATAESCTGGLVGAALTDIAGSSDVYERGYVTYSNAAKIDMLGISPITLSGHGAVSEAVAIEMADGARHRSGVDLVVSVTGIAGPGGSERKPEGRVCFAIATPTLTQCETVEFGPLGRKRVRAKAVNHALALLESAAGA